MSKHSNSYLEALSRETATWRLVMAAFFTFSRCGFSIPNTIHGLAACAWLFGALVLQEKCTHMLASSPGCPAVRGYTHAIVPPLYNFCVVQLLRLRSCLELSHCCDHVTLNKCTTLTTVRWRNMFSSYTWLLLG